MTPVAYWLIGAAFVTALLGILRMVRGPRGADRIVAFELLFAAGVALAVGAALVAGRYEILDVGVCLAVVGFVATLGWAQLIDRRSRGPGSTAGTGADR